MQRSLEFEAIGTHWKIDVWANLSDRAWSEIGDEVRSRIEQFDKDYSRFRDDSFVTSMAKTGGTFTLPADAKVLLDLYETLYRKTDGAFTPLVGNLLADSGYDATYSFSEKPLRTPSTWDTALHYTFPKLTIAKDEILDFGAGGKGYLIDIVGDVLKSQNISHFCVDAGGDMLVHSDEDVFLRVGLEHPHDLESVIGVATIRNQSIAGSSGNRRKWGKYHHIFDPHTKESTTDVLATWVIAQSALVADSLATCLFFVSPGVLADEFAFEYLVLYPDMSVRHSDDFPGELFLS